MAASPAYSASKSAEASTRVAVRWTSLSCGADEAALAAYHHHPVHRDTRAIVDPLVSEHWIADYQTLTSMRNAKT